MPIRFMYCRSRLCIADLFCTRQFPSTNCRPSLYIAVPYVQCYALFTPDPFCALQIPFVIVGLVCTMQSPYGQFCVFQIPFLYCKSLRNGVPFCTLLCIADPICVLQILSVQWSPLSTLQCISCPFCTLSSLGSWMLLTTGVSCCLLALLLGTHSFIDTRTGCNHQTHTCESLMANKSPSNIALKMPSHAYDTSTCPYFLYEILGISCISEFQNNVCKSLVCFGWSSIQHPSTQEANHLSVHCYLRCYCRQWDTRTRCWWSPSLTGLCKGPVIIFELCKMYFGTEVFVCCFTS